MQEMVVYKASVQNVCNEIKEESQANLEWIKALSAVDNDEDNLSVN